MEEAEEFPVEPLAIVTFSTGLFGTLLMLYLMGFTLAKASFRNAFGFFSLSQIISHLGLLLIICIPVTIEIQWYNLVPDKVAIYVGFFALTFQFTGLYAMALMSVNRFCAVFFPIRYSELFTNKKGLLYVGVSWIIALAQCSVYLIDGCTFTFLGRNLHFSFEPTDCGFWVQMIQDFAFNGITALLVVIIDFTTLSRLIYIYKKRTFANRDDRMNMFSKERALFTQAIVGALMYVGMIMCFHTTFFLTDRIALFWLTTFVWGLYLCLDGLSIFFIYKELRQPLFAIKKIFQARKRHISPAEEIHIEIGNSG